MQPEDFQPDDLFAQIQGLVDGLEAERQAREAAEAADKAKSELLAMVSHELCTPMEAVIAMAELLLTSPLDPTQQRYTETLAQSARSLLSVLNDVLDFSRLETGRFELASQSFDLRDLVQRVAAVLQSRASDKGLTSGVDIGANCPRFVVGDEPRVRQILMGLIDAALKGTSEGCVRLYVSASDAEQRPTIRFDVTDTGAGLSKTEQELLFQPSVAAGGAAVAESGSGLGLSIAQKLGAAMGGEVGCDSKLGQGSLYWFTLQAESGRGEGAPSEAVKDASPQGALAGHVLVVEDNTVNRMLIGAYLDEFGLTYEMVDSGGAAIMCLAAKTYDLVLMDTMMPDLDGIEITKRIRSLHAPSSEVPIVALIAHAKTGETGDHPSAGMDAHVSKPIRGRELHVALAPFLASRNDGEAEAVAS